MVTIIALCCFLLLLIAVGAYMLHTALTPSERSKDLEATYEDVINEYPHLKEWTDSLIAQGRFKETTILAPDGTSLHAFHIKAGENSSNTAIAIHGHKNNSLNMLHIAYMYEHELGFNVLLPDLRGHGKSGGDHIQMGWNDRHDIPLWIHKANELFGDSTSIVIHGISMGAATTMMAAGEHTPENVKAFVEDCGYTSVWDEFAHVAKKDYHLPQTPFLNVADLFCQWSYGWGFKEASAVEQVRKSTKPMLFIHGDADTYVPTDMVYTLYEAKQGNKELWIVPGVGHATSYHDYPEEYTIKVREFVRKHL
jgi:fermentation-respiration switch protein FrsA (DUF1100 family)